MGASGSMIFRIATNNQEFEMEACPSGLVVTLDGHAVRADWVKIEFDRASRPTLLVPGPVASETSIVFGQRRDPWLQSALQVLLRAHVLGVLPALQVDGSPVPEALVAARLNKLLGESCPESRSGYASPSAAGATECAECYGTGYWHGMGRPCSKGCRVT